MLAGGTDVLYRLALAAGHKPILDVEVWRDTTRVVEALPISTGEVTGTLASRVTRVASGITDGTYYDIISPFTDVLRAYRGIEFADGNRYRWQVFGGRITDTMLNEEGLCDFNAEDAAGDVLSRGFTVPGQSTVGAIVSDEVVRVISDAVPGALFGDSDQYEVRVPNLVWEHDRGSALDEMATAVGSFWYALANERFVLRRVPWTVAGAAVLTMRDGEGGTILGSTARKDRSAIYNQVTVTGERLDGSVPVYATVADENPDSLTYVNGPFGVRNKLLNLNTPTSSDVARGAAADYLRHSTALTEAWSFSCIPDAALELGDVLDLEVQGRTVFNQVVASIQMPLMVEGSMSVSCRAQVVGGEISG
jgi:hypothetical protein